MNTSITEMQKRLAVLTWPELVALSKRSGVPVNTIYNIRKGNTANPRVMTMEALTAAMKRRSAKKVAI